MTTDSIALEQLKKLPGSPVRSLPLCAMRQAWSHSGISLAQLLRSEAHEGFAFVVVDQKTWRAKVHAAFSLRGVDGEVRSALATAAGRLIGSAASELQMQGRDVAPAVLRLRPGDVEREYALLAHELAHVAMGPGEWTEMSRSVMDEAVCFEFVDVESARQGLCSIWPDGRVVISRVGSPDVQERRRVP